MLYRGVPDKDFLPASTLERSGLTNAAGRISVHAYLSRIEEMQPQLEALVERDWRKVRSGGAEKMYQGSNWYLDYPYMTYLRHHGYPSPLLDWSRSPFVAAFFAFHEERPKNVANRNNVCIFAIEDAEEDSCEANQPRLRVAGPRVKTHKRHYLQQSQYTVCTQQIAGKTYYAPFDGVFGPGARNGRELWAMELPYSCRQTALEQLNRMNINAYSLFGSEEALLATLYSDQTRRQIMR